MESQHALAGQLHLRFYNQQLSVGRSTIVEHTLGSRMRLLIGDQVRGLEAPEVVNQPIEVSLSNYKFQASKNLLALSKAVNISITKIIVHVSYLVQARAWPREYRLYSQGPGKLSPPIGLLVHPYTNTFCRYREHPISMRINKHSSNAPLEHISPFLSCVSDSHIHPLGSRSHIADNTRKAIWEIFVPITHEPCTYLVH